MASGRVVGRHAGKQDERQNIQRADETIDSGRDGNQSDEARTTRNSTISLQTAIMMIMAGLFLLAAIFYLYRPLPGGCNKVETEAQFWSEGREAQHLIILTWKPLIVHHAFIAKIDKAKRFVSLYERTMEGISDPNLNRTDEILANIKKGWLFVIPKNNTLSDEERAAVVEIAFRRAEEIRSKNTPYLVDEGNCEHFVNYCLHGTKSSDQIDNLRQDLPKGETLCAIKIIAVLLAIILIVVFMR